MTFHRTRITFSKHTNTYLLEPYHSITIWEWTRFSLLPVMVNQWWAKSSGAGLCFSIDICLERQRKRKKRSGCFNQVQSISHIVEQMHKYNFGKGTKKNQKKNHQIKTDSIDAKIKTTKMWLTLNIDEVAPKAQYYGMFTSGNKTY